MAFGLNQAQLIGRLGRDVEVRHTQSGGKVANIAVATDESFIDKKSGEKVNKVEWHRVVSFQDGVVDMLQKHGTKGRLVYVAGKLQTTRWKDKDGNDRYTTEILIVPGGRIQFLSKEDAAQVSAATAPAVNDPPPPVDGDVPF